MDRGAWWATVLGIRVRHGQGTEHTDIGPQVLAGVRVGGGVCDVWLSPLAGPLQGCGHPGHIQPGAAGRELAGCRGRAPGAGRRGGL